MWNSNNLVPPPINTCKINSHSLNLNVLQIVSQESAKILKETKLLQWEYLLLSRCLYRLKLQFRGDKSLKMMEITYKSLKQCIKFNLDKDIANFFKTIPKTFKKDSYFPSRQMLDYMLVRMQGYSKLVSRIVECASTVAKLMGYRLKLGHFINLSVFILCNFSRIWQICIVFTKRVCSWYNSMLPLRKTLKLCGLPWLPDDYIFPEDLFEWLNVEWLNLYQSSKLQIELPVISLLDDSEEEGDVQYTCQYKLGDYFVIGESDDDMQIVKNNNRNIFKKQIDENSIINITADENDIESINSSVELVEDIGESVSREMNQTSANDVVYVQSDSDEESQISKKRKRKLSKSNDSPGLSKNKTKKKMKVDISENNSDVEFLFEKNISVKTTPKLTKKRKMSVIVIDDLPKKRKKAMKQKKKFRNTDSIPDTDISIISVSDDCSSPKRKSSGFNISNTSMRSKKGKYKWK